MTQVHDLDGVFRFIEDRVQEKGDEIDDLEDEIRRLELEVSDLQNELQID